MTHKPTDLAAVGLKCLAAALVCFSFLGVARASGQTTPATTAVAAGDTARSTNPTGCLIQPRHNQSRARLQADQDSCYQWTNELLDWNPYTAYADLAAAGYIAALDREDLIRGLVFLAERGAMTGTVAGELVAHGDSLAVSGAEVGVATVVAQGLIASGYLLTPDDPAAQRAVARYERHLRQWDSKYRGCLKRKGYRVLAP